MNLFKTKFDAATIVLIPACIGINYLGKMFASLLKLPLWLDSIGTCIGGCLGGPIIGGICGAANNLIYGLTAGDNITLIYALTSLGIGLAAGIMARLGFMKSFPKALITACEKNAIRADRLQLNLTRQGARAVNIMRQDARLLDSLFKFDKILLDAPCSGSGTLLLEDGEPQRRMTADWLAKTAKTQKVLLQKALSLLPKKHEMVYSTCSVLQMENEDIVQSAVSMGICEVVPIEHPFLTDVPLLPTKVDGVVCVKPDERFEGFFVAKLRRK